MSVELDALKETIGSEVLISKLCADEDLLRWTVIKQEEEK